MASTLILQKNNPNVKENSHGISKKAAIRWLKFYEGKIDPEYFCRLMRTYHIMDADLGTDCQD